MRGYTPTWMSKPSPPNPPARLPRPRLPWFATEPHPVQRADLRRACLLSPKLPRIPGRAVSSLYLVLLAAALSACGQTVEFRPYDAGRFQQRSVLTLNPSLILPLPEDILRNAQARVEEAIAASPYLGEVFGPADIRALAARDAIAGSNYDALSDFVTVLGVADREMVLAVTGKRPVDLIFSLQVLHLACPLCEQDDKVGLAAAILDARTAELLWRLHLTEPVSRGADFAELSAEAELLTNELISSLDFLLKPKWHRQRFEHLRAAENSGDEAAAG